jgi:protoporphyrinogen oxidase
MACAYRLAQRQRFRVTVMERADTVGGTAASFELAGQRVDYGSHRLHGSCPERVLADIRRLLGDDLRTTRRNGRILIRDRWIRFPLQPVNLCRHAPPGFAARVLLDTVRLCSTGGPADSFAATLERTLGRTICEEFYFPFAEKLWGLPPEELDAEQARRRVSVGSLGGLLRRVFLRWADRGGNGRSTFFYPRRGFGQITEAYRVAAEQHGIDLRLGTTVTGLTLAQGRVQGVRVKGSRGEESIDADLILSTIPLAALVRMMGPAAPPNVCHAAGELKTRALVLVYLVLGAPQFTPHDTHYFPSRAFPVSRISEPANYAAEPRGGHTVVCAEVPCAVDDVTWSMPGEALGRMVVETMHRTRIGAVPPVREVAVRRIRDAYPIYSRNYRSSFQTVDAWLTGLHGLVTLGRQGLFAHDNTHHALEMAYAASDCVTDPGEFDQERWARYRRAFAEHVVDD